MNSKKNLLLIISCIIGVLIISAPTIIIGNLYNNSSAMGGLLIGELVIRITSLIIGLLIIYDAIKIYFR